MNYLLDTCVLSELSKPRPQRSVVEWINEHSDEMFYLSALTLGEFQKGVSRLPESARKKSLQSWVDIEVRQQFDGRILSITEDVAIYWGTMLGNFEKTGIKLPIVDSLIVATALTYNMTVVTRNTPDMARSGVALYDPWQPQAE